MDWRSIRLIVPKWGSPGFPEGPHSILHRRPIIHLCFVTRIAVRTWNVHSSTRGSKCDILLWRAKYSERAEDGQNYYTETQANLYISILDGTYTNTQVFTFEQYTSELSTQIRTGNWYTAQATCANLPTSGIFDATKKAEIQADIDTYVLNNY